MIHCWWRIWSGLHQLLAIVAFPLRLTRWGRTRLEFERTSDQTSFKADWAFEVASEGEFEQVRPWIQQLLSEGAKLEIIFASPSVFNAVKNVQLKYPSQVRWLVLPILGLSGGRVEKFVTAPRFVMCRYDFFPSLMALAARSDIQSGVVWASFKNRRHRLDSFIGRWWYGRFYAAFDWILPATGVDEELFKRLHQNVFPATDLRVGQILGRVEQASLTLSAKVPHWDLLLKAWERIPRERRFILGSFWEEDLRALQDPRVQKAVAEEKILLVLVPHQLSPHWPERLAASGWRIQHIHPGAPAPSAAPALWLMDLKGVLCELYTLGANAHVGGGFGVSVHSLMEPFLAKAQVSCGPRVHRSTEAELIQETEASALRVLATPEDLAELLLTPGLDARALERRSTWAENQRSRGLSILEDVKRRGTC